MLPENIITDILSRLHVKSLIRFRSVCKSWSVLISSPCFRELHRSRSRRNLLFLFRTTIFSYDQLYCLFSYPLYSMDATGAMHDCFTVKVDGPIKLVLPSCCSLVCLATDTRIYACNPATRAILPLPLCPQRSSIAAFGFGYAESSGVYKVVRLIRRVSRPSLALKLECSVYEIPGSTYWRVLDEGCPYLVEQFGYPVFAKGFVYWKINRNGHRQLRRSNDYIVSFNVADEKFSTVTHPYDWRHIADNHTQLADLGGMLCLVEISASCIVIWSLKDHHSCFWHKGGIIDIQGVDRSLIGEVKCLRNGEIVFSSFANLLISYDLKKKRFSQVPLPVRALEFGIYWEGFLPLGNS